VGSTATTSSADVNDLRKQLEDAQKEISMWTEVSDKNPIALKYQKQLSAATKQSEALQKEL
jgi:hypothetical protein